MRTPTVPVAAVDPRVATGLRAMSGLERLRLGLEMWESARIRLAAYLSRRHPEWPGAEIEQEIARRLLGDAGRAAPLRR